ncbi:hypothetical protein F0562_005264 [Nyssa sinensis]|uniref:Uncharacterized protein n=1 Tax=Nyssa sinensis TaxID=561372 RepID=A0A5J5AHL0_9ASTE|nr:hypothetical protein F0562_005264 [Nyssa sinensis]
MGLGSSLGTRVFDGQRQRGAYPWQSPPTYHLSRSHCTTLSSRRSPILRTLPLSLFLSISLCKREVDSLSGEK